MQIPDGTIREIDIKKKLCVYSFNPIYSFVLQSNNPGLHYPECWVDDKQWSNKFIAWMKTNLSGFWYIYEDDDVAGAVIIISEANDASLFKLTWC